MTQGIGNYQNIPYQQGYGAPVQYAAPQYGTQAPYQNAPVPSYQPQQTYAGYVPYGQYMPYIMPNYAPPSLYVEPPKIQMQEPQPPQNNGAPQTPQAQPQGQMPQGMNIPQNAMPQAGGTTNGAPNNAPLNFIDTTGANAQSSMNAQMPAPNLQGAQMQQSAMEKVPAQEQNIPQGMNIGVVEGPQSYSKTPITDSLSRQAISTDRASLPQTGSKKSKLTLGKVSSFCMSASFAIILTALISKIIKSIGHK